MKHLKQTKFVATEYVEILKDKSSLITLEQSSMVVRVVGGCYGDYQSWYHEATDGNGTVFHGQSVNLLKAMMDIFEAKMRPSNSSPISKRK